MNQGKKRPFVPRSGTTPMPNIHAQDLTLLRRQLFKISQTHYQALWSENGPMAEALKGKFIGKQQFEALRPDIKFLHQHGTHTQNLSHFTQAFVENYICGIPLPLSGLDQSQIDSHSKLLQFIVDALIEVMNNCAQGKESDILTSAQVRSLKAFLQTSISENKSPRSNEAKASIVIHFIDKILTITSEDQRQKFFAQLKNKRPEVFECFDFEKIRYACIRSVMELRSDAKPTFAYNQLAQLFANKIDDFSLFNGSFGLAFTELNDSAKGFDIHNTPYHVHNGVIKSVRIALDDPQEITGYPVASRWKGLVNLTNATTAFHKNINPDRHANTYPIQSLSTIYNWLLELKEPSVLLQSESDCQAINQTLSSWHDKSFDEIFKFLYFNHKNQSILAAYFNLPMPKAPLDYQRFLAQLTTDKHLATLAPHKKQFAMIIRDFAQGKLTHIGFQAELKKFEGRNIRPNRFIDRLKNYVLAIFKPGRGHFRALFKQYNDILRFNTKIRTGFKRTRAEVDTELANESVSAKFQLQGRSHSKVTVHSIKSQDKDKIGELVLLRKSISTQIDRIARSVLSPILDTQKRHKLEQASSKNTNPAYASAFSRLLFLSEKKSETTPTLPSLQDRVPNLTQLVGQTINAHEKIHDAPPCSKPTLPQTSTFTQEKLTETLVDLQRLNRKAEVRAHLMNELLSDTPAPISVF